MSRRRETILRTVRAPADSPGLEITAEIRVHYPPGASLELVGRTLMTAAEQVLADLDTHGGYLILAPLSAVRHSA